MSTDPLSSTASGDLIGGRYRIRKLLGRGGMGAVYAAENTKTGRSVALKVIRTQDDPTADATRRFLREAKAATAIQHPNVIEILDVFETDDGSPIMVMELLEGEPLADFRKRRGAVQLHEAATLFLPVLEALHAAHALSIVHRDLKPENIFLAQSSTQVVIPKVLDFGIAKVLDPTTLSSETQGSETKTGALLGTPYYMSMEQAMSEKDIDQRTDIWAVGVMLFELLCGRRPIEFDSLGAMYTTFLQGTVPSVRQFAPDLPDDVVEALDHCLQMKREERAATLEPLIAVLARYTDVDVPGARAAGRVVSEVPAAELSTFGASNIERAPEPVAQGSRSARWSAAIGLLVVALGVGAYVAVSQGGEGETAVSPAGDPEPTTEATVEVMASPSAETPSEPSAVAVPAASAVASASAAPVVRPLAQPGATATKTAAPPATSAAPVPPPAGSTRRPAVVEQLPY